MPGSGSVSEVITYETGEEVRPVRGHRKIVSATKNQQCRQKLFQVGFQSQPRLLDVLQLRHGQGDGNPSAAPTSTLSAMAPTPRVAELEDRYLFRFRCKREGLYESDW